MKTNVPYICYYACPGSEVEQARRAHTKLRMQTDLQRVSTSCTSVPSDHVFPLLTAAILSFAGALPFTCRCLKRGTFDPRETTACLWLQGPRWILQCDYDNRERTTHSLPPPFKYWCALRNSHTIHSNRPLMHQIRLDSNGVLLQRPRPRSQANIIKLAASSTARRSCLTANWVIAAHSFKILQQSQAVSSVLVY